MARVFQTRVVVVCTFFATHFYGLITAIKFSILITVIHLFFDFLKVLVFRKKSYKWLSLVGFLIDQAFHFYVLVMVWSQFTLKVDPTILGLYSYLFPSLELSHELKEQLRNLFPLDRTIFIGIIYLYITFGGAVFIRLILDCVFPQNVTVNGKGIDFSKLLYEQTGKYIGILERALLLTLVLYNSLPAVAFVLTAKSLARFRELDSKGFAEYYLIGTLVSASVAVIGGILLKTLLPLLG